MVKDRVFFIKVHHQYMRSPFLVLRTVMKKIQIQVGTTKLTGVNRSLSESDFCENVELLYKTNL